MKEEISNSSSPCIIALIVPLKASVGLIALSQDYAFSLHLLLHEESQRESYVLHATDAQPLENYDTGEAVESLTVLYGENGCGKTQFMLEACRSLSETKGERRIALVWKLRGKLYLDPGSYFKRRIEATYFGNVIPFRSIESEFQTIFYTTSPFEANKRRMLKSNFFHDVTPVFSSSNPFEGHALIRAFAKLPADLSFIEAADVRMRVKLPSLRSLLDKIVPGLKTPDSDLPLLQDRQRRTLARLDQLLFPAAEQTLVLELLIASQAGTGQAAKVLLQLASHINLFDRSNGSALLESEAKQQASQAVMDFMSDSYFYLRPPKYYDSRRLFEFLTFELPMHVNGIGRRTTLGRLASAFEDFQQSDWEMLQQASQLGVISWSFRNLSSGQVALLMLFSSISSAMERLSAGETGFLFIDEGEMFMHPAWQRRYITDLLAFLKKFPGIASRLHVILSTHSLIVAADAPPNRLFDVNTGEMTNGFGYGPTDLLDQVYRVEEFQGEYAGHLMESLVSHIRADTSVEGLTSLEAFALAGSIADDRLRAYMTNELARREGRGKRF